MAGDRAAQGLWHGQPVPAALILLVLAACALPPAEQGPRADSLTRAMQNCITNPSGTGCTVVEPERGYVVLKDNAKAKPLAWLIVPSDPEVTGIESPAVFIAPVANFWRIGWETGLTLVPQRGAAMGLAINSEAGRSENLLHIHISCVAPEAVTALAAAGVGPRWRDAPFVTIGGQSYNARTLEQLDPSPFVLLRDLPGAAEEMGAQSLGLVGRPGGGWWLVADTTRPGVAAEAEALLDEACGG